MQLKEPTAIREALIEKCGVGTIRDIAEKLNIAPNTASRALRGEPVRFGTIRTIAAAIDRSVTDIATMVES